MSDYSDYSDYEDERDRERFDRNSWRMSQREYRRARARGEQRADLALQLVKYIAISTLLLLFLRPIGVLVAIIWGLHLLSRYSRSRLYPDLRRHWFREEMRRRHRRGGGRGRSRGRRGRHDESEDTIYRDPAYRAALDEVDAV